MYYKANKHQNHQNNKIGMHGAGEMVANLMTRQSGPAASAQMPGSWSSERSHRPRYAWVQEPAEKKEGERQHAANKIREKLYKKTIIHLNFIRKL